MAKYTIARKLNLRKYHEHFAYETMDFMVEGSEGQSKEDVTKELHDWIEDYKKKLSTRIPARVQKSDDKSLTI